MQRPTRGPDWARLALPRRLSIAHRIPANTVWSGLANALSRVESGLRRGSTGGLHQQMSARDLRLAARSKTPAISLYRVNSAKSASRSARTAIAPGAAHIWGRLTHAFD